MRKIALFATVVGALVLFGIETWASIELADSADKSPAMMTGAKGPGALSTALFAIEEGGGKTHAD